MKKIFLIFCIMLFLVQIVFAELELGEIRIYVNDEKCSDADKGGGDIKVKRGDDLMIKSYFDNNYGNTSSIRLKGELKYIDNGDNIIEWKPNSDGWYDIDPEDETSKTLTFKIPDDADYDEYDLDFIVYYNHTNGTNGKWDYSWNVIVQKEGGEDKETTLEEIKTLVQNLNCSNQFNKGEEYYNLYLDCFTNNTICNSYRTENQGYKSKYDDCIYTQNLYEDEKMRYNSQYFLLNQSYSTCILSRDNYRGQRIFWAIIVGIAGIGGTWFYLKKGGNWRRRGKMATERDMTQPLDTRPDIHDLKERIRDKISSQKKEEIPDIRELEKRK